MTQDGQMPLEEVQKRLEELLSKKSLMEDFFLQQNMNAQLFISAELLQAHRSFRELGVRPEDAGARLVEAAKGSSLLAVDEANLLIRPVFQPRRNTLLLRDLPEGFTEDELKDLFDKAPDSDQLVSIKPDVNQTAYVTLKTDEAAQNVALWVRSQKFHGEKVSCSVKSEHFQRSFFPAPYGAEASWQQQGMYQPMDNQSDYGWKGDMNQGLASLNENSATLDAGYMHEYRKYSRQYIYDVCNCMKKVKKPEGLLKLEQEVHDARAFIRSEARREWAPVPLVAPVLEQPVQGARHRSESGRRRAESGRSQDRGWKDDSRNQKRPSSRGRWADQEADDWNEEEWIPPKSAAQKTVQKQNKGPTSWVEKSKPQASSKGDRGRSPEGQAPKGGTSWADKVRSQPATAAPSRGRSGPPKNDGPKPGWADGPKPGYGPKPGQASKEPQKWVAKPEKKEPKPEPGKVTTKTTGDSWADKVKRGRDA